MASSSDTVSPVDIGSPAETLLNSPPVTISSIDSFTPGFVIPFERIGAGSSGSVWANEYDEFNSKLVIKREDGIESRSLVDEWAINQRVIAALVGHTPRGTLKFSIVQVYGHIPPDDPQWRDLAPFPGHVDPCFSLVIEKIQPFDFHVRNELIGAFIPPEHRYEVARDPRNNHCLIRPYLGRHARDLEEDPSAVIIERPKFFTLRNMVLHIDELERINLDVPTYAIAMAEALAFLYWVAKVDANGVELVLAPPRLFSAPGQPFAQWVESYTIGGHVLWLLDFDQCKGLPMDERGMEQAAEAFLRNDPYFPRPGRKEHQDQILWSMFRDRFLFESDRLLEREDEEIRALPMVFMAKLSYLVEARALRPLLSTPNARPNGGGLNGGQVVPNGGPLGNA